LPCVFFLPSLVVSKSIFKYSSFPENNRISYDLTTTLDTLPYKQDSPTKKESKEASRCLSTFVLLSLTFVFLQLPKIDDEITNRWISSFTKAPVIISPLNPPQLTAKTLSQLKTTLGWKTQQQQQQYQYQPPQTFGKNFLFNRPSISEPVPNVREKRKFDYYKQTHVDEIVLGVNHSF